MRIALNMASLRGFGSSSVGFNVWREFSHLASDHECYAWVSETWFNKAREHGAERARVFSSPVGALNKLWTENIRIRRGVKKLGVQKLFSLGDTGFPAAPVPHLLLIQLAYLAMPPSDWGFEASRAFRLRMRVIDGLFRASLPSLTHLTVQTTAVKEGLMERWGISSDQITVIPSSIEAWICELNREPGSHPYICYISAWAPQKNHSILAETMAALRQSWPELRCKVTVTREEVPDLVQRANGLGVLQAFDFEGSVSHRKAMEFVQGAVAAVIPSRIESFGIPYYEAMAVGCPVIAADRAVAREACGNVGRYADPDSGEAFAAHVQELLASPDTARDRSLESQAHFRKIYTPWSEIAGSYLKLLESI